VGTQGRYQVPRTDAPRVRRQFRLEVAVGAGHGQSQDGRADVVLGLTTLPLPPDREDRGSEQLFDLLPQLLTWHSEHLQLPIARCYLLLQRPLRLLDERRRRDVDPLGQEDAQGRGQGGNRGLPRLGRPQPHVEVLPERLATGGQGKPEADQGVGHEPL